MIDNTGKIQQNKNKYLRTRNKQEIKYNQININNHRKDRKNE